MKLLILSIAALVPAACAAPQQEARSSPSKGGDCFNVRMVNGYSNVDRDTVRLDAGPSRTYDVDLSGPLCDQLDWAHNIALESTPSSWICTGDHVGQGKIFFRDATTRQRVSCYIEDVRRVPKAPKAS